MAIKVFFNNSCSVCRLEINHYKKIADSNLEWIDITNNNEALKLTSKSQEELLRRLHVIDDGKVIVVGIVKAPSGRLAAYICQCLTIVI